MAYFDNILGTIGNTPIVKLNKVTKGLKCTLLAKLEFFMPGGSVKDRIGINMIEDAERRGVLKPGGTIIEGTSGNTGLGLAIAAAIKGYRCIFVMNDKQSSEKINALKAFGADVVVCPTAVRPEDPRSYYSVAKRLSEEIPNSFYPYQYGNPANPKTHYDSTGPEIWRQLDGKIDAFIAGMGTGGTISGIGKFLKEKNPAIKIVGVDPIGSLYYDYFKTGKIPPDCLKVYKTEGIGEDFLPTTMDFSVLDDIVQVGDKEAMLATRALARKEGICAGGSSGSAVHGALEWCKANLGEGKVALVLIPDTGMRYLTKVYNDEWMKECRFLEPKMELSAAQLIERKQDGSKMPRLLSVSPHSLCLEAVTLMKEYEISQIPVIDGEKVVGSVKEDRLIHLLINDPASKTKAVKDVMEEPFPVVEGDATIAEISALLTKENPAVLLKDGAQSQFEILTKADLIRAIAR
ncbi:MAG TPA: cystathionine beta-synthase [Planctomycetota bacterium]|nr:cystathionine beta-synthase [Planctomycetota bacterium]